jgi:hypothetical protein
MKLILRTLAATAIVVLTADAGLGATAGSRLATASSRLHDKKLAEAATRLAHLQLPKASKPKVASRNGAAHATAAAVARKGGAAAPAQKGGALAAVMPMQHAPAAGVPRGAIPATRVLPTVSRPPAFQAKPPPATAAQGGAISGTGIKPHPSALAALGGPQTGKGTALIGGTSMRPKKR